LGKRPSYAPQKQTKIKLMNVNNSWLVPADLCANCIAQEKFKPNLRAPTAKERSIVDKVEPTCFSKNKSQPYCNDSFAS
jgi:hypothetical protein